MITTITTDKRETVSKILNSTSVITLIESSGAEFKTLESLSVSANTTATFSLILTDGTTDFYVIRAMSVGAGTPYFMPQHHLTIPKNWSLKCVASAGNTLHVIAVIINALPQVARK